MEPRTIKYHSLGNNKNGLREATTCIIPNARLRDLYNLDKEANQWEFENTCCDNIGHYCP